MCRLDSEDLGVKGSDREDQKDAVRVSTKSRRFNRYTYTRDQIGGSGNDIIAFVRRVCRKSGRVSRRTRVLIIAIRGSEQARMVQATSLIIRQTKSKTKSSGV